MKVIAPDYFNSFSCLMGECRHSCCKGWEIDIDEDSLEYYKTLPDGLDDWVLSRTERTDDGCCFRMTEDGRCPFLNDDGLCSMILRLGKDSLCDICSDHPVFRNWYSDRIECGLGICCESACSLILSQTGGFSLTVIDDDGDSTPADPSDEEFYDVRRQVFDIALNREMPLDLRVGSIEDLLGIHTPDMESLTSFMKGLEMLDITWSDKLASVRKDVFADSSLDLPLENLLLYLLYRHSCRGFEFPLAMWRLIRNMCFSNADADIFEICRMWSCEIEYSDVNPDLISAFIQQGW